MKAAVLQKQGEPLEIVELVTPVCGVGQVLVRVRCATICGKQLAEISGAAGPDPYLPHLLGHEGGGEVIDVGPGVTHVRPGDRVVMHWRKGIGIEAEPPKYLTMDGEEIGAGPIATFTEFAVVSENRLTRVENDVPFEVASLMGCAVTTGLGLVNNEAKLKIGQSVAVIGCGGVGLNVIQGAAMVGAWPIVAIDAYEEKLGMAALFGGTHFANVLSLEEELWPEVVERIVGKTGADVVVECTGDPVNIDVGLYLTKSGGRMVLVGQPRFGDDVTLRDMRQHYVGKTILDSQGGLTDPTTDIPRYLQLYKKEKLVLDGMITHRFSLGEINEAIEVARSGKAGKVCLEME